MLLPEKTPVIADLIYLNYGVLDNDSNGILSDSEVSDFTNSSEILEGRVKTLHPKIHAGILNKRDNKSWSYLEKNWKNASKMTYDEFIKTKN